MSEIINDKRPIQSVWDGPAGWQVGTDGVTCIEAYPEAGECGWVPYIRVWKQEHLFCRMAAHGVVIFYQTPTVVT